MARDGSPNEHLIEQIDQIRILTKKLDQLAQDCPLVTPSKKPQNFTPPKTNFLRFSSYMKKRLLASEAPGTHLGGHRKGPQECRNVNLVKKIDQMAPDGCFLRTLVPIIVEPLEVYKPNVSLSSFLGKRAIRRKNSGVSLQARVFSMKLLSKCRFVETSQVYLFKLGFFRLFGEFSR